ncbi:MAG: type II toxin-antitoxin system HicB family antitoxin [Synergistaceae bacterium]|jgi:predicted RNase H-like HicB family nuclease|nr:type II toxin-antitoxin system HicB family antitoxin [Synergistaceae bacterium]
MKDRYTYPALFAYEEGSDGIGVVFPDFPGCVSHGENEEHAMKGAQEALALHLWAMERDGGDIPEPSALKNLDYKEYEAPGVQLAAVLVNVWMALFREEMDNKSVTRAVTLPHWLDMRAKEAKLNYSQTLQDGLMARLGLEREINHKRGRRKTQTPA